MTLNRSRCRATCSIDTNAPRDSTLFVKANISSSFLIPIIILRKMYARTLDGNKGDSTLMCIIEENKESFFQSAELHSPKFSSFSCLRTIIVILQQFAIAFDFDQLRGQTLFDHRLFDPLFDGEMNVFSMINFLEELNVALWFAIQTNDDLPQLFVQIDSGLIDKSTSVLRLTSFQLTKRDFGFEVNLD